MSLPSPATASLLVALEKLRDTTSDPLLLAVYRHTWATASEHEVQLLEQDLRGRVRRATRVVQGAVAGVCVSACALVLNGLTGSFTLGTALLWSVTMVLVVAAAAFATLRAKRRDQLGSLATLPERLGERDALLFASSEATARAHHDDVLARRRQLRQADVEIFRRLALHAREVRQRAELRTWRGQLA